VASAVRTPIGSCGGQLSHIPAIKLAAAALNQAVCKAEIDPGMVDDVIIGHSHQEGEAVNSARTALLTAGWPGIVPGLTLDRRCCSGLDSVLMGVMKIQTGNADIIVAGGMESISLVKTEECSDSEPQMLLGVEAAAKVMGVSRQQADQWALRSHQKAIGAIDNGYFEEEIAAVTNSDLNNQSQKIAVDETPDRTITLARLETFRPFVEGGICTAGNSSNNNDGAAAVVLMSEEKAHKLGIIPLAYFRSCAIAAMNPKSTYTAVGKAVAKALKSANLHIDDIDLLEIEEIYAAQALIDIMHLNIPSEDVEHRINVNGSGIALGHPIAATGTMRMVSMIHEMKRRRADFALETICGAGGQVLCTILEGYSL